MEKQLGDMKKGVMDDKMQTISYKSAIINAINKVKINM